MSGWGDLVMSSHAKAQKTGDTLVLGGRQFTSRLLMGTGKFSDRTTMLRAIRASGAELVTVALRRFNTESRSDDLYGPLSKLTGVTLMPNTSGARNADEAVRAALVGRELTGSPFLKLEIHPNPHHLMPDPIETFEAAKRLVKKGFIVLPYMGADRSRRGADCGKHVAGWRGHETRSVRLFAGGDAAVPVGV